MEILRNVMKGSNKTMVPIYLRKVAHKVKRSTFGWQFGDNLRSSLTYRFRRHSLSGEEARVLAELNSNGVAITSVPELLGTGSCYDELETAVEGLENDLAGQINAAREAANDVEGWKTYVFELLGEHPILDPNSVFVRFALQRPIREIVNAYYGMYTQLNNYNVWLNFPTQCPARDSQLWHVDPEDHWIIKVFVLLTDVDDGAGPTTYAAGSHPKGSLRRLPASFHQKRTRRTFDSQMAEVIPPKRWVKAVGPKGTMIFADTRGYHKGGHAQTHDRIMYNCMFVSPACTWPENFVRPQAISTPLDREEAFALKM